MAPYREGVELVTTARLYVLLYIFRMHFIIAIMIMHCFILFIGLESERLINGNICSS